MKLMKTVEAFSKKHPNVRKWLAEKFHDDATRDQYGWQLLTVCKELKVEPEDLLPLAENKPSKLFRKIRDHLENYGNNGEAGKAIKMKCAIASFVDKYNENPIPFKLNIKIKSKPKWERPPWKLKEWQKVFHHINHRYRPLFEIGAMCGLGRRELVYLNSHLDKVKPVPDVADPVTHRLIPSEAVYLEIPPRKSNSNNYKAILPRKEYDDLKGPLKTTHGGMITEINLTQQFNRATQRAGMTVKGTGSHIMRAIFRSVGGNADIAEKYLEWQMGHFEKYHYDRNHEDIEQRAKAFLPLWSYFREGPQVASRKEIEQIKTASEQQVAQVTTDLKQQIDKLSQQYNSLAEDHRILTASLTTKGAIPMGWDEKGDFPIFGSILPKNIELVKLLEKYTTDPNFRSKVDKLSKEEKHTKRKSP